jgi:hypothetical protein
VCLQQEFSKTLPKRLILAIKRDGILLLRIPDKFTDGVMVRCRSRRRRRTRRTCASLSLRVLLCAQETLLTVDLRDIFRWAHTPGVQFYFEVKSESEGVANTTYTFATVEVCVRVRVGPPCVVSGGEVAGSDRACNVRAGRAHRGAAHRLRPRADA